MKDRKKIRSKINYPGWELKYFDRSNNFRNYQLFLIKKYLEKDVIRFEPRLALDGGLDGISEIRKIIARSSELIKFGGKLVLEIANNQKKEVKELLKKNSFYINSVVKDLAKNDRCIISTKIKK